MKRILASLLLATLAFVFVGASTASAHGRGGDDPTITEWYTWKVPSVKNSNPQGASDVGWPQKLVGKGQITNPPCGVWYQIDKYTGKKSEIYKVVKDGVLEYTKDGPEDRNIVKSWYFKYGGDCIPEKPKDKVEYTNWQDEDWKCGDTTTTQTRTKTVTTYKWDKDKKKWVGSESSSTETRTRDLTKDEQYSCTRVVEGDDKTTDNACTVPADGTRTYTETTTHWTRTDTWNDDTDTWTEGTKVYSSPVTKETSRESDENCRPDKPKDKVEHTDWVDGKWVCDDTTVTQTRTTTTTPYVWDEQTNAWVEGTSAQTTETQKRDLTEAEQKQDCQEPSIDGSVVVPVCLSDAAWLTWNIALDDPDNQSTDDGTATITLADGKHSWTSEPFDFTSGSGKVLWPGAKIENGKGTWWPGYITNADGTYTATDDPAYFGWTRGDNVTYLIKVNPEKGGEVNYPPASPKCKTAPPEPPKPPTPPHLSETGVSEVLPYLAVGAFALLTGGFILYIRGRRKA